MNIHWHHCWRWLTSGAIENCYRFVRKSQLSVFLQWLLRTRSSTWHNGILILLCHSWAMFWIRSCQRDRNWVPAPHVGNWPQNQDWVAEVCSQVGNSEHHGTMRTMHHLRVSIERVFFPNERVHGVYQHKLRIWFVVLYLSSIYAKGMPNGWVTRLHFISEEDYKPQELVINVEIDCLHSLRGDMQICLLWCNALLRWRKRVSEASSQFWVQDELDGLLWHRTNWCFRLLWEM